MSEQQTSRPIELFYSYAHSDERLRKRLETHLSALRQQGAITEWHDRKIVAGTDWKQSIDAHLMTATVILLLISPDFLASDYCYGVEMQRALARHAADEASGHPSDLASRRLARDTLCASALCANRGEASNNMDQP